MATLSEPRNEIGRACMRYYIRVERSAHIEKIFNAILRFTVSNEKCLLLLKLGINSIICRDRRTHTQRILTHLARVLCAHYDSNVMNRFILQRDSIICFRWRDALWNAPTSLGEDIFETDFDGLLISTFIFWIVSQNDCVQSVDLLVFFTLSSR